MKIRNGFVSNSSSSSFIVGFPRKPNSAEEVFSILFGSGFNKEDNYKVFCWDTKIQHICERIFSDITNYENKNEEELIKLFEERNYENIYSFFIRKYYPKEKLTKFEFDTKSNLNANIKDYLFVNNIDYDFIIKFKEYLEFQEAYYNSDEKEKLRNDYLKKEDYIMEEISRMAREDYEFMMKDFKDYFIFVQEYSDRYPIESSIEHGNVFRKIPHIRFSHH